MASDRSECPFGWRIEDWFERVNSRVEWDSGVLSEGTFRRDEKEGGRQEEVWWRAQGFERQVREGHWRILELNLKEGRKNWRVDQKRSESWKFSTLWIVIFKSSIVVKIKSI